MKVGEKMAFQKNASDQEICEQLCPFQIGDKVILTKKLAAGNGFFERGTVLKIQSVAVRSDLKIHAVPLENLSVYHADIGIFTFELADTETGNKAKATADYWGESLISKQRLNRLLLQLYVPAVMAAICLAILLLIRNDFAAVAVLALGFLLIRASSYSDKLRKTIAPDIWKLH